MPAHINLSKIYFPIAIHYKILQKLGAEHPDTINIRKDYIELMRTMQEQQGAVPPG